ncbi:MAG: chloride channel protein [Desulfonauticus sp.]|nr:chloride channel protein [Desulfonauticus sp.]
MDSIYSKLKKLWQESITIYNIVDDARLLMLGTITGVLSGLAASLFFAGVEGAKFLLLHKLAGTAMPAPAGEEIFFGALGPYRPWLIPIFCCLAGLITGWLIVKFVPKCIEGGTDGTDSMIKAFHRQEGIIKPIVALIRGGTAILTIGAGGSAGREGPISLIGAGIGSFLAEKLKLTPQERRLLLLTGAAGGLGAIFRAPLGGALTAVEVIYREDFEAEAILPAVTSSVVAYTIFTLFFGNEPIFGIPKFFFTNPAELIFYAILALFCSFTGKFYVKTFFFIKYKIFWPLKDKLGIPFTLALGGLLMGTLGAIFPQLLSGGYGWLELAILGKLSVLTMVLILVGKTIATSMTLGSGMSGGMFAPALFVGGMSGGVVGYLAHSFYPHIVSQPGAFVLVGMAAFFAGIANAPIGPLIMVCEFSQGYGLLAPLMLSSAICLVINRNISLYENQVHNKFESPAHLEDATINLLENLKVKDYYQPKKVSTFEENTSFKAMLDVVAHSNDFYFPVRGKNDQIIGIVSVQDLRRILFEDGLAELLVAKDVARKATILTTEDNLYNALVKFLETNFGQLPVVDPEDPTKIVGLISREDVFKALHRTNLIKQIT